jgi:Zn-finger nucleic acid-binding protein
MRCPTCQIDLSMTERQGIEIDYCPQCRGVWLDRGELDKIIERSTAEPFETRQTAYERRTPGEHRWDEDDEERYRHRGHRRKSFLGELFDWD